jgi:hypothetical protein
VPDYRSELLILAQDPAGGGPLYLLMDIWQFIKTAFYYGVPIIGSLALVYVAISLLNNRHGKKQTDRRS